MPNSQQSTLKETSPHGRCKWPKSRQPEKLGTPETAAQQEDSDYLSHDYWVTGEVRIINLRDLAKDELSKIKLTNEEEEWLNTTKDSSTSELIEKFTKTPEGKVKEAGENSSDKDSRSAEKHPQWLKVKSWWSRKMKERLKTARDHLYVFLTIVSGIMEKVLTGHYLIGWKVLMLVFTITEQVSDLGEKLEACIKALATTTTQMNYLRRHVRGKTMQEAVGELVCSYVLFGIKVRHYQKNWYLVKVVKGFGNIDKGLKDAITQTQECWKRLESIQMTTILANTFQTQALVRAQARFHSSLYIEEVFELLDIDPHILDLNRLLNSRERRNLAPKDRWKYHLRGGIKYSKNERPLLWLYGKPARRNISWVSSFSADISSSLNAITNIKVADVFCKHRGTALFTPLDIILRLIVQILRIWPEIVLEQTHNLSRRQFKSLGRFQPGDRTSKPGRDTSEPRCDTSKPETERVWELLFHILQLLKGSETRRSQELMILIDRLDLCRSSTDFTVLEDLIPRLQQLSHEFSYVRVMITTARQPARVVSTLQTDEKWLMRRKLIR